jgi:hypothetical protein
MGLLKCCSGVCNGGEIKRRRVSKYDETVGWFLFWIGCVGLYILKGFGHDVMCGVVI